MHEGKNLHYSASDQKPLCSFSGKVCNQRRLNNYGFCIRHILEDTDAPFKRCAYVAKSSKHMCTQPIPNSQDREYCNNHMQVLGILPKKERKPKKGKAPVFAKDRIPSMLSTAQIDAQISSQITSTLQAIQTQTSVANPVVFQNRVKSRLTVGGFKPKLTSHRVGSVLDDTEDPYAFPADPADNVDKLKRSSPVVTSLTTLDMSPVSSRPMNLSVNRSKSPGDSNSGYSSLAKIYPELAEKLEKIKPKAEPKTKEKSKSSRTLNSLQTKIAQNKIKDKLKNRNQGSSNTSSQSQSPSHGFASANSPSFHINTSSPYVAVATNSPSLGVTHPVTSAPDLPVTSSRSAPMCSVPQAQMSGTGQPSSNLSHFNQLNSLNLQALNLSLAQLGLPVPTASDIEQTLKQLAKAANIPLDGFRFNPEAAPSVIAGSQIHSLPPGTLLPTNDLFGLQNIIRPSLSMPDKQPPPYSTPYSNLPHHPALPFHGTIPGLPVPHIVSPFAVPQAAAHAQGTARMVTTTEQLLAQSVTTLSSSSVTPTQTLVSSSPSSVSTVTTNSLKSPTSSIAESAHAKPTKSAPARSRCKSKTSSTSKRPIPVFTLPMTLVKPRKVKNILPESSVKRIKTESAKNYYNIYKKRRLHNHHLMNAGFDSSDDTSDSSDCDMLPWQPDWFTASSDEDPDDDDLEYDLRATKLALRRARLRRQCFQSRQSYRSNKVVQELTNDTTSTLISATRDRSRPAVGVVQEITGNRPKPIDKYKIRGLEKRKCCYKNDEEVRCPYIIVPYANHCMKHIMYNVDQQLFEYCTAKFADNTQCCVPVIDMKHELPLCIEHGIKADNYQKTQDNEPKPKRPRKKTKPSALTRPPKKGKKKKNQRKVRAQKPIPPDVPSGDTEMPDTDEEDEDVVSPDRSDGEDTRESSGEDETPSKSAAISKMAFLKAHPPVKSSTPNVTPARPVRPTEERTMVVSDGVKKADKQGEGTLPELDNLGGLGELVNVKMFGELPTMESASKLLEENDFQEVFNKLPDEAFDLFSSKNGGGFDPTFEEVVELEKSLAEANIDFKHAQDSFEQMSDSQPPSISVDEPDELPKQIADEILSRTTGPEVNLGRSLSNSDAQESIKAIARSLSTSGMLLASEKSGSPVPNLAPAMPGPSHSRGLPTYEQIQQLSMQLQGGPQLLGSPQAMMPASQQSMATIIQQSAVQHGPQPHIPASQQTTASFSQVPATLVSSQHSLSQPVVGPSHMHHGYQQALAAQQLQTSGNQAPNILIGSATSTKGNVGLTLGNFAPSLVTVTSGNFTLTPRTVSLPSNVSLATGGLTLAPGNMILAPHNVIQQSRMVTNAPPTSVSGEHVVSGPRNPGFPAFPGGQHLTLQQLTQLIQQTAALQQLQLPPYTPRPPSQAAAQVPRSVALQPPPGTMSQARTRAEAPASGTQTSPVMSTSAQVQAAAAQAQITQIQVAVAPGSTHISVPLQPHTTSIPPPTSTTNVQASQASLPRPRVSIQPTLVQAQPTQLPVHPVQMPFHPTQIQVHTTQIPVRPTQISLHPSQVHSAQLQVNPTHRKAQPQQIQVHPAQLQVPAAHNQTQLSPSPSLPTQAAVQPPSYVQSTSNPSHKPPPPGQPTQAHTQPSQLPSRLQSGQKPGQAPVQLTQQQLTQQQQHLQQQQQQLARQQEQLNQLTQQQHLLAQQLLQQHIAQLSQQGLNQLTKTLPVVRPPVSQAVPVSGEARFVPANLDMPTTNIVWNPPPNVTLTYPNGLPHKPVTNTSTSSDSLTINVKDTKIDLSHIASQLPAYHLAQSGLQPGIPPPPSYPSSMVTTNTTSSTHTS